MRILQVVEPGVDGVFRHVEGLTDHLLRRGHAVALAYSSRRGSDALGHLVERVRQPGNAVLDLAIGNAPGPADLRAGLRLLGLMRRWNPEVVHCHSSKAGALARPLAALLRKPCFYTPNAYFGMGQTGLRAEVFSAVERALAPLGQTIHVSTDEAEFARRTLRVTTPPQRLIPNGIDTGRFHPPATPAERVAARERLGLPTEGLLVGTLGRLSFQKNPETLYHAIAPLVQSGRTALVHVGTGELDATCAQLATDLRITPSVHRRAYLSDPADFYRAIDMFALLSRYEGLSLAVLEALASNLPVVLSEAPGNLSWRQEGLSHARWVPVGDPPAATRAIEALLATPETPNHRGVIERRFSAAAAFTRIEELYSESLAHRTS